jgi:Fur family ferric uptake transcriptional regulator
VVEEPEGRHETPELSERLRDSGHRLTPQRAAVLAAVERLGHGTPEQVYAEVSDSMNLSTVYRTLELLDELGVIRHAHLSDRAPTYHARTDHEHVHLVCRGCQSVISVGESAAASALGPLVAVHDFEPDYGHLVVFGLCASCRTA